MLEAIIIICYAYVIRFWKFRGRTFADLNQKEQRTLINAWNRDRLKHKYTVGEYLSKVQSNAFAYLLVAIVLSIFWVLLLITVYLSSFMRY